MGKAIKNEIRLFRRTIYLPIFASLLLLAVHLYMGSYCVSPPVWVEPVLVAQRSQSLGLVAFLGTLVLSCFFCARLRDSGLEEAVRSSKHGLLRLLVSKGVVLLVFCALVCVGILIYDLVWMGRFHLPNAFLYSEFQAVLLHYFLPGIVAILLGMVLSLCCGQLAGYGVVLLTAFLVSPASNFLFVRFAEFLPVGHLKDLLVLFPVGDDYYPDALYGYPGEGFRFFQNIFWISLLLFPILWALRPKTGWKLVGSTILLALAIGAFPAAFYQIGSLNKANDAIARETEYTRSSYTYYAEKNVRQEDRAANFSVSSYRMRAKIGLQLEMQVTMTVDQRRSTLDFTLNHNYCVERVQSGGKDLSFRRDGDYLWVQAEGAQEITLFYKGSNTTYYANGQGCFLPGYFSYYPMAGLWPTYDSGAQQLAKIHPDEKTHFELQVSAPYPVFSNLAEENGIFIGEAEALTLAGSPFGCMEEKGGRGHFFSSLQQGGNFDWKLFEEAETRCAGQMGVEARELPEQFVAFILPMTPTLGNSAEVFSDSLVVTGHCDMDALAVAYLCKQYNMQEEKRPLLNLLGDIEGVDKAVFRYRTRLVRYSMAPKEVVYPFLYAKAQQRVGPQEAQKQVYRFLVDEGDRRDVQTFLEELCGFGEAVKEDEEALQAP